MSKPLRNANLATLAALLLLAFALPLPSSAQQTIALRFIDYESGKTISNIAVLSVLWNGTSLVTAAQNKTVVSKVSAKTGKEGQITVTVPSPTPEHLNISSLDTVNPVSAELSVPEILKEGVVVPYRKGNMRPSATAGQVIILTRRLSALNRAARETP
jgi:hypothetical protein